MGSLVPDRITAVQDRLGLTVEEAKRLLKISGDDDDEMIRLAINAAKAEADAYMNNPFWELAETTYNATTNWRGNRIKSELETEGWEFDEQFDPIRNTDERLYDPRLNNSVPDLWTYPRVELPIPPSVKLGVVKYIELILSGPTEGVASERIGDWQVTYSSGGSMGDRTDLIKRTFWDQYRLSVGF